jgi:hypothetical protein
MIDDSGKKSKLICCSTCLTLKMHVDPGVTVRFIQSTRLRGTVFDASMREGPLSSRTHKQPFGGAFG